MTSTKPSHRRNSKVTACPIAKTKPESLGLDTVEQHTGYLDVDALDKHFFYWFSSPETTRKRPNYLVVERRSRMLFFHRSSLWVGTFLYWLQVKTSHNPYSWNTNASVIFLDQPVEALVIHTLTENKSPTPLQLPRMCLCSWNILQKFPPILGQQIPHLILRRSLYPQLCQRNCQQGR